MDNLKICKNCDHWNGRKQNHMRICTCPKMRMGYSVDPKSVENDGVLIEDDEGWGWFTAPGFGCIHFKKVTTNG